MRSIPSAALAAAAVLAAAAAPAQEQFGTLSGTLGGVQSEWFLLEQEGEAGSSWRRAEDGVAVRLAGRENMESPGGPAGALIVEFRTEGGPQSREVETFAIRYRPAGNGETVYRADGTNADLSLDALSVAGDRITVAGRVSGKLIAGGAEELVVDGEDTRLVDVAFQGTLPRAE